MTPPPLRGRIPLRPARSLWARSASGVRATSPRRRSESLLRRHPRDLLTAEGDGALDDVRRGEQTQAGRLPAVGRASAPQLCGRCPRVPDLQRQEEARRHDHGVEQHRPLPRPMNEASRRSADREPYRLPGVKRKLAPPIQLTLLREVRRGKRGTAKNAKNAKFTGNEPRA
jgi:hypothetical protein